MKPRVAVIAPCFAWGGTERWTFDFICAMQDEYHVEVGVMADKQRVRPGAVHELARLCPVAVQRIDKFPDWLSKFDVIKTWGPMALPRMLRGVRAPIIGCCHGGDAGWTKRWVDLAMPYIAHWVAVSRAALVPLAQVPPERTSIIHNATDVSRCVPTRPREEIRASFGFAPHEFVVGYLGRMAAEKRVPVIADAVGRLGGNYRGFLVGNGRVTHDIDTYAGRVVVHPQTFTIGDVLAAMDCVVGLCDAEGFWRVGIEAAIAGVPVVATRVGVLQEIADQHGVLWEEVPIECDVESVATAIKRLRATDGLQERTTKMQMVANTFSLERFGQAWKDLLRRMITTKRVPWKIKRVHTNGQPTTA